MCITKVYSNFLTLGTAFWVRDPAFYAHFGHFVTTTEKKFLLQRAEFSTFLAPTISQQETERKVSEAFPQNAKLALLDSFSRSLPPLLPSFQIPRSHCNFFDTSVLTGLSTGFILQHFSSSAAELAPKLPERRRELGVAKLLTFRLINLGRNWRLKRPPAMKYFLHKKPEVRAKCSSSHFAISCSRGLLSTSKLVHCVGEEREYAESIKFRRQQMFFGGIYAHLLV